MNNEILQKFLSEERKTEEKVRQLKDTISENNNQLNVKVDSISTTLQQSQDEIAKDFKTLTDQNCNDLEMLKLKNNNERKELEIALREVDNKPSDNIFVNMLNVLKEDIANTNDKMTAMSKELCESCEIFKNDLSEEGKKLESKLEAMKKETTEEKEFLEKNFRDVVDKYCLISLNKSQTL